MGVIGIIIIIVMLIAGVFLGMWAYEEVKYSWKMNQMIDDNNATCYLERGFLKFPLARICSWNNTIHVERTKIGPNNKTKETYLEAVGR